jgi:adenylate cyclase
MFETNSTELLKLFAILMKSSNLQSLCFGTETDFIGIRHSEGRYDLMTVVNMNYSSYIMDIDTLEKKSFILSTYFDPTTRPWYVVAVEQQTFTYTKPYWAVARFPSALLTSLSVPIYVNGTFAGVLFGSINLSLISNVISTFHKEKHSKLLMIDVMGRILGTSEAERIYNSNLTNFNHIPNVFNNSDPMIRTGITRLRDKLGSLSLVPTNGTVEIMYGHYRNRYRVLASALTDSDGLFVIATIVFRESDIMRQVNIANEVCCAVCSAVILLVLLVSLGLGCLITRPMKQFSAEMSNIGNMEFEDKQFRYLFKLHELTEMQDCMEQMKIALRNFEKFVPAMLVKGIVKSKRNVCLGVVSQPITILFVDIKNFTTMAESVSSCILIDIMNVFFSKMSDIIHHNQGTVDKYVCTIFLSLCMITN